jgi:hypothetical protein
LKLLFFLGSTASGRAAEAILDPSIFALCSISFSGVYFVLCFVRVQHFDEPTDSVVINEVLCCLVLLLQMPRKKNLTARAMG